MPVWVMAHDGGCEGHSPPIQAFATEDEARRALAMVSAAGAFSIAIFEVPLWPETPQNGAVWSDLKPIKQQEPAT